MSLLERAVSCALDCDGLDRVVISTDDQEIANEARRCGAEVPFLRPAALAQDDSPKWGVFRHLIGALEGDSAVAVEILVDLDVTVAGRTPQDVAGCLELLVRPEVEVAVTAYRDRGNPYYNVVEIGPGGIATIVKAPAHPVHDRQSAPDVYSLSPAVFAIRREALKTREHWSTSRIAIYEIPRCRAWDIDDEIDLEFVDFMAQKGLL